MSSELNLIAVGPQDAERFAMWHETLTGGLLADRPLGSFPTLNDKMVEYSRESVSARHIAVLAFDGETTVGAAEIEIPIRDNKHLLMFDLGVPPAHRRKGYGTRVLSYIQKVAVEEQRGVLFGETSVDVARLEGAPGPLFAQASGFESKNTEIRRTLTLPIDDAKLESLAIKAAERASEYRIVGWSGPVPEEYAEQYTYLKGLLNAEAPLGDLDLEPEYWDVARLRDDEARIAAQGRTLYTTIAIAPDGALAGHTQILVAPTGKAFQWDTLVLGTHRGRRLGLALKVDNHRRMQADHPEVEHIHTWNAEQNGPMITVNEQLGFEITELVQEWQR